jgi:hypothetical protein
MSISRQSNREHTMSLLSIELSRERIRAREQEFEGIHAIARARADRRAQRTTRGRVFRVPRISLTR